MHIVNGCVNFFKSKFAISQPDAVNEASPLLQTPQSLTADFEDFEHSDHAVRTALLHTLTYYVVVVILFSFVVESWPIIDSLYFATVLFTTIGYGDLSPSNDAGRIATMFLALYGITILGIFLSIYGGSLVDSSEMIVKERQKKFKSDFVETMAPDVAQVGEVTPEQKKDSSLFQDVLAVAALETPIFLVLLVLGLILGHFEGWSIIESLYWTMITGTTVGFGDDSPRVPGVRLASVVFLPFAVAVVGQFLGRVAGVYLERKQKKAEERFLQHTLTLADIRTMDVDKDGEVNKLEFLTYMLVTLQHVEKQDIDVLCHLFDQLDTDKNGRLNMDDLQQKTMSTLRKTQDEERPDRQHST